MLTRLADIYYVCSKPGVSVDLVYGRCCSVICLCVFFFQAEAGIRVLVRPRGLGDVYKRRVLGAVLEGAGVGGATDLASQVSQGVAAGWLAPYSREQELQADQLGAEYLARNRYNPKNMVDVIGVLKKELAQWREPIRRIIADHPTWTEGEVAWKLIEDMALKVGVSCS